MKKVLFKAQISVFVVVAAILVLIAGLLVAFNSDSIEIFVDEKSSYKVKQFIETCLDSQSREAMRLVGIHGGWLYHPDMIFTDRNKPDEFNRRAKGLSLFEETNIPYWFYYNDKDEEFVMNVPDYDSESDYSLRGQVSRYLEEHLERDCIQGFQAFEDVYEIKYEPRDIKGRIEVEFDDDEVISSLELPLEIVEIGTDNAEYIDYFQAEMENKLWIPYHIARDITLSEANDAFVEFRILNFLQPYQTTSNRDMLPPFYDFRMEYDFEPWRVSDVEKLVKQIINSNIGLIQFLNTDYDEVNLPENMPDTDFVRGFQNMYVKDYLSENSAIKEEEPKIFREYDEYKVKGIYETFFPSYFHLAPALGNMILLPRPEAVAGFLPFFFTEYVATYEMTMPVIFEIKSNSPNEKFVFNLALEANIDYNDPLMNKRDVSFEAPDTEPKTLICDPVQFVSDWVSFNISDPVLNGEGRLNGPEVGIEDAVIMFNCKNIASCYMGQTQINGEYITKNVSQVKLRLPLNCDPGSLDVYKFGHKRLVIEDIDAGLEGDLSLGEFIMPSKKTMDLKVKTVSPGGSRYSTGNGFTQYDQGFLIFTSLEDDEIVEVVEIDSSNLDDLTIDLTIGNYSVDGFLIYNKSFTIPAEEFCYETGLFSGEDCEQLPQIDFDSWVRGGLEVDRFEVTKKELLARNTVVVDFVDIGIPGSYADLESLTTGMADLGGVSHTPFITKE